MYNLIELGFNEYFKSQMEATEDKVVGRVSTAANGIYKVVSKDGMFNSHVSGRFYHQAQHSRDFPCVGDWVLIERLSGEDKAVIHHVLERQSLLSRHAAGEKNEEQLMAANVDTVLLVNAMNNDFNLRRMERYLMVVYESGAMPVFVLTKKDLCTDEYEKVAAIEEIAPGVPIHTIDGIRGEGIEALKTYVQEGKTLSLIGSSGVGKSTLINHLIGKSVQVTQGVRGGDDRGRHTTTHREMFLIPGGGIVIDTPGMRELQLWTSEDSVDQTFQDIEMLAKKCQFNDCQHKTEPKCSVKEAIENGDLTDERLKSYRKLQREIEHLGLKEKYGLNRANRIKVKKLQKGK